LTPFLRAERDFRGIVVVQSSAEDGPAPVEFVMSERSRARSPWIRSLIALAAIGVAAWIGSQVVGGSGSALSWSTASADVANDDSLGEFESSNPERGMGMGMGMWGGGGGGGSSGGDSGGSGGGSGGGSTGGGTAGPQPTSGVPKTSGGATAKTGSGQTGGSPPPPEASTGQDDNSAKVSQSTSKASKARLAWLSAQWKAHWAVALSSMYGDEIGDWLDGALEHQRRVASAAGPAPAAAPADAAACPAAPTGPTAPPAAPPAAGGGEAK
jgi:hypothetical protein